VHGMFGPLRQVLGLARPWQRVALGAVVLVVGVALESPVVAVVGVLLVALPVAAAVRQRRHRDDGPVTPALGSPSSSSASSSSSAADEPD